MHQSSTYETYEGLRERPVGEARRFIRRKERRNLASLTTIDCALDAIGDLDRLEALS